MIVTGSSRLVLDITKSPGAEASPPRAHRGRLSQGHDANAHRVLWLWITLLGISGFLGVAPVLKALWDIWTTDPLRSIGSVLFVISIVLVLRVWRRNGWELKGTLWGLVPVALAFAPSIFSERVELFWSAGATRFNFLPSTLPVFLYVCGITLVFAGVRVCLQAWFPLALLLFLQPVPQIVVQYFDLPLQGVSAHIARSFAALLGLSPTNTNLLRLMFTPSFGMFIAPGCDGMRGAITMAYGALIGGYLKRLSVGRWILCVAGGFFLGHVFNLVRLCALVIYYKVALGHPALEQLAKQADYVIGGVLFLIAASFFLWLLARKDHSLAPTVRQFPNREHLQDWRASCLRSALLALLVFAAIVPSVRASRAGSESVVSALQRGEITPQDLNGRMPPTLGGYKLVRAWQEEIGGSPVLQAGEYSAAPGPELEIGIWLLPTNHSIQASLLTRGDEPKVRVHRQIPTAGGRPVSFSTALYDDGVTQTLIGDTYCSASSCWTSEENGEGMHFTIARVMDHVTRGERAVPIFFKIQVPRTGDSDQLLYSQLLVECQQFLSQVDLSQLGQRFQ